ncbi:MAG: Mammalian cell entry related domain protein [Solirubrobacterales bacterium]|nr:Mammalian cell entry related domain protein [Solirubrobacterales bacterium]
MRKLSSTTGLTQQGTVGLVGLVLGVAVLLAGLTGHLSSLFGTASQHEVRATFVTAQQVRKGTEVRLDGVKVGQVKRVGLQAGGRASTVTMDVDDSAGPLYRNARAGLRWKTVLGGSFYVQLQRGTPGGGPLPATGIPVEQTFRQVELDDITSVLRGGARAGLQRLPKELATALRDPRVPARLLDTVGDVAPDLAGGLRPLRGTHVDQDLQQLISNTAKTVAIISRPRGGLRQIVDGVGVTLRTTAARDADISSTLTTAPAAMRNSRATLARLTSTLELADPLLKKLHRPAAEVGPTLADLHPTVTSADRLLTRATPLLRSLRPAARSLAGAAVRGLPLVDQLSPSLERLDKSILPMLSEKDPGTTKSTAVMIGGTMAGVGSGAVGQTDVNGHFIRFPVTSGSSPIYTLPCQTYIANPDKAQIIECQSLQQALTAYLNYKPLEPTPAPPASTRGSR